MFLNCLEIPIQIKTLERILKINNLQFVVEKGLVKGQTITKMKIKLPEISKTSNKTLLLTPEFQEIHILFDEESWKITQGCTLSMDDLLVEVVQGRMPFNLHYALGFEF